MIDDNSWRRDYCSLVILVLSMGWHQLFGFMLGALVGCIFAFHELFTVKLIVPLFNKQTPLAEVV